MLTGDSSLLKYLPVANFGTSFDSLWNDRLNCIITNDILNTIQFQMIEKINKCLAFEIFDVYIFMKINNFFRKFIFKSRNHAKSENKNLARAARAKQEKTLRN